MQKPNRTLLIFSVNSLSYGVYFGGYRYVNMKIYATVSVVFRNGLIALGQVL
jgi:hypothetical protein